MWVSPPQAEAWTGTRYSKTIGLEYAPFDEMFYDVIADTLLMPIIITLAQVFFTVILKWPK